MKRKFLIASLFSLMLFACNKKDNDPATVKEYFRGKVDGVFFSDTVRAGINTFVPSTELLISGVYPGGSISLNLKSYSGTSGERILNETNYIYIHDFSQATFYAGSIVAGSPVQGSGKINILEITNSFIRGTFECVAPSNPNMPIEPAKIITEGEFKLKK